ncbi:hypothetical protein L5G28_07650 [Gordonia sp. HY285]|uniref:hypothetical protein n=1 Tax=Gordonia liuliyuniae TaxID=2911517 RepID=UPI001F38FFDE|nr:hypothetical protein [Gordonia liuliyuniae]MCF8610035.1 hypothetical protein [Gordonia liuliyuniae]
MTEELLDTKGLAALARVSVGSMRVYVAHSAAARRDGAEVEPGAKNAIPPEDYRFGQSPVWLRSTVEPWLAARSESQGNLHTRGRQGNL